MAPAREGREEEDDATDYATLSHSPTDNNYCHVWFRSANLPLNEPPAAQGKEGQQEAAAQVHDRLHDPRGRPRAGPRLVREVPARPHQGGRQDGRAGRGCEDHAREDQAAGGGHAALQQALPQVPDQEVPEEAAAARLPARHRLGQEHVRAALLQHPRRRQRRRRGRRVKCSRWPRYCSLGGSAALC
ncbi:hypothetical protein ON010_g15973 [Phytophthora cinnamomi]|nr:hypothetical protein ON010_g15973 [Phytophthora cinnamomi]